MPAERPTFTIMLSAAGRRVALLRILQRAAQALNLAPRILTTDLNRRSAAYQLGDIPCVVPSYREPGCLDALLRLCEHHSVKLIVPTIDPELPFYAEHRDRFREVGATAMISSPEAVRICNDKRATHRWLTERGFPRVEQADAAELLASSGRTWSFPAFVKRRGGSASIGARAVHTIDELRLATADGDYVVQQLAMGDEYTVDVFVDAAGRCRCAVPRLRLETRGGEVSKGVTVRSAPVIDLARRVAEALPGARGVLNVQIFFDATTGQITVNEINARFGGGYPLAEQAGATMAQWVIEGLLGRPSTAADDGWADGLVMLRYDEAVFCAAPDADVTIPAPSAFRGATRGATP